MKKICKLISRTKVKLTVEIGSREQGAGSREHGALSRGAFGNFTQVNTVVHHEVRFIFVEVLISFA